VRLRRCESRIFSRSLRSRLWFALGSQLLLHGRTTWHFRVKIKCTLPLLREGCWLSGWLAQAAGWPNRDIGREVWGSVGPTIPVSRPYCAAQAPNGQITHMAEAVLGPTLLPLLATPVAVTVSVNCIRPAVNPNASALDGK